ncbi:2-dehydropantoate 2-reductase [Hyphomicrobiales bacterium]|nr:2-dehydropantoate 2-reductase [Hyphomicrobiales bacterium]
MRIAVLGAGAVALGNAAFLSRNEHQPIVWSPSGKSVTEIAKGVPLTTTGALEGTFELPVAASCEESLRGAQVVLIAVPAYGYKTVMDAASPYIRPDHLVIISGHLSFGALYLSKLLAERGVTAPIAAFGTTVTTGRRTGPTAVNVKTIRAKVDMATVPATFGEKALGICTDLFGDRFVLRSDLLAIMLSNLNPQSHMGTALCNLTRMERGEAWDQDENTTDAVGNLLEALDAERIAVASALGLSVRTVREHFHYSFNVPIGPVGEMARVLHGRGRAVMGPTTLNTRYILEDVPFGLLPTIGIARVAGVPIPLHEAGINLFSALYGREFRTENDILPELDLDGLDLPALQKIALEGYRRA